MKLVGLFLLLLITACATAPRHPEAGSVLFKGQELSDVKAKLGEPEEQKFNGVIRWVRYNNNDKPVEATFKNDKLVDWAYNEEEAAALALYKLQRRQIQNGGTLCTKSPSGAVVCN